MEDNQICRPDGWFSVKDRMPEDGVDVLVFIENTTNNTTSQKISAWWSWEQIWTALPDWDKTKRIDFWQPLPTPPNTDLQNFMEKNGLGPEDMRDDNKYPTEIS